jgi:uncharacterized membrane protein
MRSSHQSKFPGHTYATAYGVNDAGQVVGSAGNIGFVDTDGQFTFINYPGASETALSGINDAGQIIGTSDRGSFLYRSGQFIYSIELLCDRD